MTRALLQVVRCERSAFERSGVQRSAQRVRGVLLLQPVSPPVSPRRPNAAALVCFQRYSDSIRLMRSRWTVCFFQPARVSRVGCCTDWPMDRLTGGHGWEIMGTREVVEGKRSRKKKNGEGWLSGMLPKGRTRSHRTGWDGVGCCAALAPQRGLVM